MRNTGRLRRLAGTVAATLLATTMLLAVAATAQAEEIVLSETMVTGSTGHIEVTGDVPVGATHVTVAQCNLDDIVTAIDIGRRCNFDTSVGFTPVGVFTTVGVELDVWDQYEDFDFVLFDNPDPATTTECAGTAGDEDCAVAVSYYAIPSPPNPPIPSFIDAEAEEISFEAP